MKQSFTIWLAIAFACSCLFISCKKDVLPDENSTLVNEANASGADDSRLQQLLPNDVVVEWSNIAYEVSGGALEGHPLLASRIKAMTHIAMHDALNAVFPVYQSYAYHPQRKFNVANPFAAV